MPIYLNADKQFSPFEGNEISFEYFTFSGGEPHVKINTNFNITEKIIVTHRIKSFNDLGKLCVIVDALKNIGATLDTLFVPYFPAARQDRLMVEGEPLTVRVYSNIINSFRFSKVILFDVHSDVAPALINNCFTVTNHAFIKQVLALVGCNVHLVSPDGGALKKIYKLSSYLKGNSVIECSKTRDVQTGALTGFKVYAEDLMGIDCLIVDDICDGGGTFIGLAEELKRKNAGKLYLAVSHGIFSKGLNVLLQQFEKIFTTNSFCDIEDEKLITINLNNGLLSK